VTGRLSAILRIAPELVASAELVIETKGEGLTEFTREAADFVGQSGAGDGVLMLYLRHTSASLTIQENADPDVQADLVTALRRLPILLQQQHGDPHLRRGSLQRNLCFGISGLRRQQAHERLRNEYEERSIALQRL